MDVIKTKSLLITKERDNVYPKQPVEDSQKAQMKK